MADERMKVATSIPSLKNKIKIDISPDENDIFWYIRFNMPLDASSVSYKTMDVTDTEGYIMRTDITYDQGKNMIIISPIDSYEDNIFYMLNISKRVKSATGQNLRSKIHILFKLMNAEISEFRTLKTSVKVPAPRQRPKDYEERVVKQLLKDPAPPDKPKKTLQPMQIRANVVVALIGILLLAVNIFLNIDVLWIAALAFCIVGGGVLLFQLMQREQRSAITYNRGLRHYKAGRTAQAQACFHHALQQDPRNKMAKYAITKLDREADWD